MSNGFSYYVVPETHYLETSVNHWLAEALETRFGSLPVTIEAEDLHTFLEIVGEMHELNRPSIQPLIEILQSGKSIVIDRD